MQLTAELLQQAVGCARGVALTWAKPLAEACASYQINTAARLAAFLAQVGHESSGLIATVENLNYRAEDLLRTWPQRFTPEMAKSLAQHPAEIAEHVYAGRMGNKAPGDGYKFRGRGLLPVRGRANYEAVRDLLCERVPAVPDLLSMPEALAEPKWAALSAAAYWSEHELNALADVGDFARITRRINEEEVGTVDRMARYERARRALA